MFTIKLYRFGPTGSIQHQDSISCHAFSKIFHDEGIVTIVPRAAVEGDQPPHPACIIAAPGPDIARPYRYDVAYVENAAGKTVDTIRTPDAASIPQA